MYDNVRAKFYVLCVSNFLKSIGKYKLSYLNVVIPFRIRRINSSREVFLIYIQLTLDKNYKL